MSETIFLKKSSDMKTDLLRQCHGGVGDLIWTEVLNSKKEKNRILNFFHDNILKPGISVGIHEHTEDEEYYYIISGKGIMTLDGNEYEIGPGDITAVYPGGFHGLRNHTEEDLRFIVISVSNRNL